MLGGKAQQRHFYPEGMAIKEGAASGCSANEENCIEEKGCPSYALRKVKLLL